MPESIKRSRLKRTFFIVLRIILLAVIIHFSIAGLEHLGLLMKLGKTGEITIGCICDHLTFGWEV